MAVVPQQNFAVRASRKDDTSLGRLRAGATAAVDALGRVDQNSNGGDVAPLLVTAVGRLPELIEAVEADVVAMERTWRLEKSRLNEALRKAKLAAEVAQTESAAARAAVRFPSVH